MSMLDVQNQADIQSFIDWVEESRGKETAEECRTRIEGYRQRGLSGVNKLLLLEAAHNAAHRQEIEAAAAITKGKFGPGFHLT